MSLLTHLHSYTRRDATADAMAGVLTAAVLVPQALAFAALAGLPPQAGLYASVLPPLVYALAGGSRVMAVGPVSVASLMVASALASVTGNGARIEAAALLALLVAGMFLLAGLLRAGTLINFISSPVLHGFTSGAAILITVSQLPALLGMTKASFSMQPAVAALGLGSLALLYGWQRACACWAAPAHHNQRRNAGFTLLGRAAPLAAVTLATLAVVVWNLDGTGGIPVTGLVTSA